MSPSDHSTNVEEGRVQREYDNCNSYETKGEGKTQMSTMNPSKVHHHHPCYAWHDLLVEVSTMLPWVVVV